MTDNMCPMLLKYDNKKVSFYDTFIFPAFYERKMGWGFFVNVIHWANWWHTQQCLKFRTATIYENTTTKKGKHFNLFQSMGKTG